MQQWQRDQEELGYRAWWYRREENRGSVKRRLKAVYERFPFRYWDVKIPATGGTVRVRTYMEGWPGSWKDSVLGNLKAREVFDA